MKKALFIGATCIDVILYLERLPKTEEDIHPEKQIMRLGGCAGNAARACRLVTEHAELASPVGTGVFGELTEKLLGEAGLSVRIRSEQENGCCYCFVEKGGERTFLSVHGAEYVFHKEWMGPFDEMDIAYVYVCGLEIEEPTGEALIGYLGEHPGRQIVYCPGPRGIPLKERNERLFALHPILHLNKPEALELSGKAEVTEAAEELRKRTENTVIVTLGAEGAYALPKEGEGFFTPGEKATVVNTIGAGDTHAGAFIGSLLEGMSLTEAVARANHAAAKAVESESAVPEGV